MYFFLYRVYLYKIQCGTMKLWRKLIDVRPKMMRPEPHFTFKHQKHLTELWGDSCGVPGFLLPSHNFIPEGFNWKGTPFNVNYVGKSRSVCLPYDMKVVMAAQRSLLWTNGPERDRRIKFPPLQVVSGVCSAESCSLLSWLSKIWMLLLIWDYGSHNVFVFFFLDAVLWK